MTNRTDKPEVVFYSDHEEPFYINGLRVGYDAEHTFVLAIHKDIAESKYQDLIAKKLLVKWDPDDDYRWEGSPEDLAAVREHYWHHSSLVHALDEDDNYEYGEIDDDVHFNWLGIDEEDVNEEYCDIGNG